MAKKSNDKPSQETVDEAMKIARATQRPGQSKEQTKLIAQGIEKGIAQYKKQQKVKARAASKAKKQSLQAKVSKVDALHPEQEIEDTRASNSYLPWILLALSWVLFVSYTIVV
ncbi:hypothetical protein CGJ62_22380 [Vibrio parahaemolyticus]|uniref:DUF2956 domain-containing protein n=1 Tax=Vibrio parahaemolyticus TaxID=670 RepID=UPI001120FD32|nr:DUF2956 domain-containing protein [Vibrio parahaemolyticus]MBE4398843.1 DUF2956 family protein [Vibrio parahaemolyticus]TOD54915.1 hypothetical protein CGJ62_22380 [Vibrio parahaemolyticus]